MTDATSSMASPFPGSTLPRGSGLTEQLWQHQQLQQNASSAVESGSNAISTASHLPLPRQSPKTRSLSDASKRPQLLQSPALRELSRTTKDDIALHTGPETPTKKSHPSSIHGLSLQLPPRQLASPSASNRAPLSPQLDAPQIYGSPASVLPRRSRGLDFSRACTNLHHSTLAESSPDSSPTVGGRGVNIPQRRGTGGSAFGSPSMTMSMGQQFSAPGERTAMSSSVSSVNMLESDTSSSEEDEDDPMNGDQDMMMTATPQPNKLGGTLANPFGPAIGQSPGNEWMGNSNTLSPAASSLLSFQRARFRNNRKSRHSSSSASGNSSKPSPAPLSPPAFKSIESGSGSYFSREMSKSRVQSRRESLSLGTRDLHLSDLSDDGESRATRGSSPAGMSNPESGPRGVIRRAVTRRGNLLPKTKTFARIRAALMEESAPLDSEAKREAAVIRQVRENDTQPTRSTSPKLTLDTLSTLVPSASDMSSSSSDQALQMNPESTSENSFSRHAKRNSRGVEFWNQFEERYRTPPPQIGAFSRSLEDTNMEATPQSAGTVMGISAAELSRTRDRARSRSPTPQPAHPPTASEFRRKRRRDDDLDPNLFKRRAVSPGMSVQSSPVLNHSPVVKDGTVFVAPPKSTPAAVFGPEISGGSGNGHAGMKRVGLQGMTETNDGLMNMSIE